MLAQLISVARFAAALRGADDDAGLGVLRGGLHGAFCEIVVLCQFRERGVSEVKIQFVVGEPKQVALAEHGELIAIDVRMNNTEDTARLFFGRENVGLFIGRLLRGAELAHQARTSQQEKLGQPVDEQLPILPAHKFQLTPIPATGSVRLAMVLQDGVQVPADLPLAEAERLAQSLLDHCQLVRLTKLS